MHWSAGFHPASISDITGPAPVMSIVKPMHFLLKVVVVLAVLACPREVMAVETNRPPAAKLSVTNLLANKSQYKGKRVEVRGYYLSDFECSKLSEHDDDSNKASIWIYFWHVKPGHEKLIKTVAKGQVRVIGTFDFKQNGSGHLGRCAAEITDLELFEPLK